MQLPVFGQKAKGERLERIEKSPNYRNEQFHNQNSTTMFVSKKGMFSVIKDKLFDNKHEGLRPKDVIPTIKTDLKSIPIDKDIVVWFGHSSFFLQVNGKKILVDPVFSTYASPVPFIIKAFDGTEIYSPEDMPDIDVLLIAASGDSETAE